MWYDMGLTLSYNCLFNFVIGGRGCGKTYGCKKRAIKNFLENGKQFVYLRRFQDEIEETAETYFDDILVNEEFENITIEYRGNCYFINEQLAGYSMCLTKAKNYKSSSFPLVDLIIFDEFLIEENGYTRYLKNEVKTFLGFYMSIDRYRGVKVFFLANATTMANPYFMFWDINLPYGSNISRKGDILLHLVDDIEFTQERKKSRFGQLIKGTDFEEYVIDNKFMYDTNSFIKKKTGNLKYFFTFVYETIFYGVWIDEENGKMYISEDIDKTCNFVYSTTTQDHSQNTMLTKSRYKNPFFKKLIDNFKLGNVYFENQKVKNNAYQVIKMFV